MDTFKETSRRRSRHYSDYKPNNDLPRGSESPKSVRRYSTFECKVCLNTYPSNKELYLHLHSAQHLRPLSRIKAAEVAEHVSSRKRKFDGFLCKVCDEEFSTHGALKTHLNKAGHHWSTKREKYSSEQDKSSYDAREKHSVRNRHPSSSRSENSFILHNGDLNDIEDSRGKCSSLSVRSSGSSDMILDDSSPMLQNDDRSRSTLGVGFCKSGTVEDSKATSNLSLDNSQSIIITSPDNSFPLQSKIPVEVSSTSEHQKSLTVIPIEPHCPTLDPRQSFPCDIIGKQSKNLNHKLWQPIYQDRANPKLTEKRIPWKLIPIDFSSSDDSKNERSQGGRPASLPSPPEDPIDPSSIDQLAEQLKENTGATFIPPSGLETNFAHSPVFFEGSCSSQYDIPSHVSSTSASEELAPSRSSTPCVDEDEPVAVDERNSVTIGCHYRKPNSPGHLLVLKDWDPDSTSGLSPYSPKCDYPSSPDKTEVPKLHFPLVPKPIPPPKVDRQQDAAILEHLGTFILTPCTKPQLQSSMSFPICSQEVVRKSNTQNVNTPQTSSFVVENNHIPTVAETINTSPPISEPDVGIVESKLSKLFVHPVDTHTPKNVACDDSSKCSSNSSPEPMEQLVTIGAVDSCPKCQTPLDSKCLHINLRTGNCSTRCYNCGIHIVMEGGYKKKR